MSKVLFPRMLWFTQGFICVKLSELICINPKLSLILGFSPRFDKIFTIEYLQHTFNTIKDGEKSHLLFSFLVRNVLFCIFRWDLFVKNSIISFYWFHLNNYTPLENRCFDPEIQNQHVAFVTPRKLHLRTNVARQTRCTRADLQKIILHNPRTCAISPLSSNGWAKLWQKTS